MTFGRNSTGERWSKARLVVGLAVLLAGAFALHLTTSAAQTPPAKSAPVSLAAAHLVALKPLTAGACRTDAPAGWKVTDHNAENTIFSLASADGVQIASYAGVAVGAGQVAGFYGPQYRTPEAFALFAVGALTSEQAQISGPAQSLGAYKVLKFTTRTRAGYVLLYTFPVPDPGGYGVIMRISAGKSGDVRAQGAAGDVAAAVRCTAALVQHDFPVYHAPREADTHGAGQTACPNCNDNNLAGTYNAQLGTGWVHDGAGNNYNIDVNADYRDDGPQGPGYYKVNGNDVIKLTPGLE